MSSNDQTAAPLLRRLPPSTPNPDWVIWSNNLPVMSALGVECLSIDADAAVFVLGKAPVPPIPAASSTASSTVGSSPRSPIW